MAGIFEIDSVFEIYLVVFFILVAISFFDICDAHVFTRGKLGFDVVFNIASARSARAASGYEDPNECTRDDLNNAFIRNIFHEFPR